MFWLCCQHSRLSRLLRALADRDMAAMAASLVQLCADEQHGEQVAAQVVGLLRASELAMRNLDAMRTGVQHLTVGVAATHQHLPAAASCCMMRHHSSGNCSASSGTRRCAVTPGDCCRSHCGSGGTDCCCTSHNRCSSGGSSCSSRCSVLHSLWWLGAIGSQVLCAASGADCGQRQP